MEQYYEINPKETQLAKEKARQMKEAFKSWVWEDVGRREKYVEKYNYLFNAICGREYDGSHQTFPGMNPAIKLRPHQENAVLRGKLGGNTLLAHCVGAGKSFGMIATTMEKKRLGLINKGCVVVPKHLTLQMASEWMRLYPNAKLLSSPKDNSLCFEKLGFDYLVCDEAHYYKNCFVATKMSNVAGVQITATQKSEDMLMKTQYLNDKYGCNNILLSTGTPVSNSMVEFYVMQRYLRPDLLKKAGLGVGI